MLNVMSLRNGALRDRELVHSRFIVLAVALVGYVSNRRLSL